MLQNTEDTIAAIATPPGRAGIGVVRISGPQALAAADLVFKASIGIPPSQFPSHAIHFGRFADNGVVIDECLVSVMKAPHSYTGQDTVEFSLHGSPVILRQALACCIKAGARQAGPGEFTFRAFYNGKLDLARAEAVCDLISSTTDAAAKASVMVLEGALSVKITAWRDRLLSVLMLLETAIDHAGDDFEPISQLELSKACKELRNSLGELLNSYSRGRHLRNGIRVVICGRPNTGKSSLMNALLQRDRAIVSDIPGTTRDIIEETLEISGLPVVIVDTAGLRGSCSDPVETIGQGRARKALEIADTVLWLIDGSTPADGDDKAIGELLQAAGLLSKTSILINKADLPAALEEGQLPPAARILHISCLNGLGLDAVERALGAIAEELASAPDLIFVNERHCDALRRADASLAETEAALSVKATEDILAFHVREALDCLGEITGDTADEEILDRIFSNFCIGK
jgi:tRNA modification GTPase